jgi:hypothetical protein
MNKVPEGMLGHGITVCIYQTFDFLVYALHLSHSGVWSKTTKRGRLNCWSVTRKVIDMGRDLIKDMYHSRPLSSLIEKQLFADR